MEANWAIRSTMASFACERTCARVLRIAALIVRGSDEPCAIIITPFTPSSGGRVEYYSGQIGRLGLDLGVYGVPETFVLDAQGIIRYKQVGPMTPEIWRDEIKPLLADLKPTTP